MGVITAVSTLTSVTFVGYGVALAIGGGQIVVPASLGVAITWPPTVATLLAIVRVWHWRPDAGPLMVLAGTSVRMVWAVGVVAVLQGRAAAALGTTPTAIAEWTTGFYLLTLATETVLLWRLLSRPGRPSGVSGDVPSDRKLG